MPKSLNFKIQPTKISPVNLLHIFRAPFPKKTSVGLLLDVSRALTNISHGALLQECVVAQSRL